MLLFQTAVNSNKEAECCYSQNEIEIPWPWYKRWRKVSFKLRLSGWLHQFNPRRRLWVFRTSIVSMACPCAPSWPMLLCGGKVGFYATICATLSVLCHPTWWCHVFKGWGKTPVFKFGWEWSMFEFRCRREGEIRGRFMKWKGCNSMFRGMTMQFLTEFHN